MFGASTCLELLHHTLPVLVLFRCFFSDRAVHKLLHSYFIRITNSLYQRKIQTKSDDQGSSRPFINTCFNLPQTSQLGAVPLIQFSIYPHDKHSRHPSPNPRFTIVDTDINRSQSPAFRQLLISQEAVFPKEANTNVERQILRKLPPRKH